MGKKTAMTVVLRRGPEFPAKSGGFLLAYDGIPAGRNFLMLCNGRLRATFAT